HADRSAARIACAGNGNRPGSRTIAFRFLPSNSLAGNLFAFTISAALGFCPEGARKARHVADLPDTQLAGFRDGALEAKMDHAPKLSLADREFPKEAARVRALAFDPTGRWLATGGDDGKIRVWDFRYFAGAASVAARGPITSLAYSPDGRLVASGSEDGTVQLWDALRWKEERALIGHKG